MCLSLSLFILDSYIYSTSMCLSLSLYILDSYIYSTLLVFYLHLMKYEKPSTLFIDEFKDVSFCFNS